MLENGSYHPLVLHSTRVSDDFIKNVSFGPIRFPTQLEGTNGTRDGRMS